jgi:DNA-binding NarL/FixJ family response regulator
VIRTLVVDDQQAVRAGLAALLETQDDMTVVATAANGEEAVQKSDEHRPDVVLMDIRMPVLDGIAATRSICTATDGPRVLVLTTFDLDEYVYTPSRPAPVAFFSRTLRPTRCSTRYA